MESHKRGGQDTRFESDKGVNCLTGQLISCANDGSLGDTGVQNECRFNFRSRQAMSGDVDNICDVGLVLERKNHATDSAHHRHDP